MSLIKKRIALLSCALTIASSAFSQSYTGVSGIGWREVSFPIATSPRATAQAAGTYTPRPAVMLEIDNPSGLVNSPLPQVVKDNILRDGMEDGVIYIDRDVANSIADGTAATKYAAHIRSDSGSAYNSSEGIEGTGRATIQRVTAQGLFCRSGWRDYTLTRNVSFNSRSLSKEITGIKMTLDGNVDGSADVQIAFQYKKSDWSFCLPYAFRFKHATAKGKANLNNSRLALTASVSTTVAESFSSTTLYKGDGYVMIGPVPVWYDYRIPFDYGYKVILTAAATADYSSQMNGTVTFDYLCANGSCTGTNDTSSVWFSSLKPNWGIQADAVFDPFVRLGLVGRLYPLGEYEPDTFRELAMAGIHLRISSPLMVSAYYGNACGDANNDRTNETIQTYLADLQARVSLETSWSILNARKRQFISTGSWAGRRINGGLQRLLSSENNHTPLWNKKIYYTDSGSPSVFSPILRQLPAAWNGSSYEHALKVSMRPCLSFEDNYYVDLRDSLGKAYTANVPSRTSTADIKVLSSTPSLTIAATGVRDDDGRQFSNTASSAPIVDSGTLPPPVNGGTFAFVSKTHSLSPGTSGDIATIVIRNSGNLPIGSISYSCSGASWHNYGNAPASIAVGQSGTIYCQSAASGAYPSNLVVSVTGTASNSPFKPF